MSRKRSHSSNVRTLRRWLIWYPLAFLLITCSLITWSNFTAIKSSENKLYDDASLVPKNRVALVFGCSHKIQGKPNLYFTYRMDAAQALWEAGAVQGFIVSGDNRTKYYNEPKEMRNALIKRGIPAKNIICDYAGLRTLDSVVRANEVFGCNRLVLVSQQFHNERACYIAEHHGIDIVGLNAQDVPSRQGLQTNLREYLARVNMVLDIHILGTRPTHLGSQEELPF